MFQPGENTSHSYEPLQQWYTAQKKGVMRGNCDVGGDKKLKNFFCDLIQNFPLFLLVSHQAVFSLLQLNSIILALLPAFRSCTFITRQDIAGPCTSEALIHSLYCSGEGKTS